MLSIATAAEDLRTTSETLRKRLSSICMTFGWHFDAEARVFYIPSWWRWNAPENANVLKGNLKDPMISRPAVSLRVARNTGNLPETLLETFSMASGDMSLNHRVIRSSIRNLNQKVEQKHSALRAGLLTTKSQKRDFCEAPADRQRSA